MLLPKTLLFALFAELVLIVRCNAAEEGCYKTEAKETNC